MALFRWLLLSSEFFTFKSLRQYMSLLKNKIKSRSITLGLAAVPIRQMWDGPL